LAEQGFEVHLVEKEVQLGGNLRRILTPMPSFEKEQHPEPVEMLKALTEQAHNNRLIHLHLASKVVRTTGFKGNFTSIVRTADGSFSEVTHGVTILATGGVEYRGPEYGYGSDPRIITQQQFEAELTMSLGVAENLKSVLMIQCIGPAEKYCSRICCTVALKNAVIFKRHNPSAQVVILHRDIRAYGFKEHLYTMARQLGVLFVRYDPSDPPRVEIHSGDMQVWYRDMILGKDVHFQPDRLVLSMPVVPDSDNAEVAKLFKVPVDENGFFLEAHVKLRPVDFSTDGVFMAGMAHYPKLLDESIIQAQAAASRAARLLCQGTITAGGQVAVVDPTLCTGCLTCVRVCPFLVPQIRVDLTGIGDIAGAAFIEPTVCQGCGTCVAECPGRAIQLMHYTDAQMAAKVRALVNSELGHVQLEMVD